MARLNLLSDVECKSATTKGKAIRKLHDGGGLYLWVYADGRKYWRLRYKIAGSEKSLSLGVYPATVLKKARARRDEERQHLEANLDPAAEEHPQPHYQGDRPGHRSVFAWIKERDAKSADGQVARCGQGRLHHATGPRSL